MTTVNDLLLAATSAHDAARAIYRWRKASDRKVTLGYLCRRATIRSTGHLADYFAGRRPLRGEQVSALAQVLGLTGAGLEYFCALVDEAPADRLAVLRKYLARKEAVRPVGLERMFFALEVFCAFGLFENQPTQAELRDYFGVARGIEVELALSNLISNGCIALSEGGRYAIVHEDVQFGENDAASSIRYLQLGIDDARKRVAQWFPCREEALFSSSVVSVRRADYERALPALKEAVHRWESAAESGAADQLVRVNVQVYPLRS